MVVSMVSKPDISFLPLGGEAGVEYVTAGNTQTRTCRGCGVTETVEAEGKGKARTFPGWFAFEKAHAKCGRRVE